MRTHTILSLVSWPPDMISSLSSLPPILSECSTRESLRHLERFPTWPPRLLSNYLVFVLPNWITSQWDSSRANHERLSSRERPRIAAGWVSMSAGRYQRDCLFVLCHA